jgi:hypothetical protein
VSRYGAVPVWTDVIVLGRAHVYKRKLPPSSLPFPPRESPRLVSRDRRSPSSSDAISAYCMFVGLSPQKRRTLVKCIHTFLRRAFAYCIFISEHEISSARNWGPGVCREWRHSLCSLHNSNNNNNNNNNDFTKASILFPISISIV